MRRACSVGMLVALAIAIPSVGVRDAVAAPEKLVMESDIQAVCEEFLKQIIEGKKVQAWKSLLFYQPVLEEFTEEERVRLDLTTANEKTGESKPATVADLEGSEQQQVEEEEEIRQQKKDEMPAKVKEKKMSKIEQVVGGHVKHYQGLTEPYGKVLDYQLVTNIGLPDKVRRFIYMERFEKGVLVWGFNFYKSPTEGWLLSDFWFNDRLEGLFKYIGAVSTTE